MASSRLFSRAGARFRVATTCLVPALMLACSPGEPPAERREGASVISLARLFPVAEIETETARLDLGSPAARRHLRLGFGDDEGEGKERYVWGLGEASELDFVVLRPRDLELVMHCRTLEVPGSEQHIAVTVNGREVGAVSPGPDPDRLRLTLPAESLRSGSNRLRLEYAVHRRPKDLDPGNTDGRSLAVQWYELSFGGASAGDAQARADTAAEPPWIEVPPRQRVAFYLDVEPGSELRLEEVAAAADLGAGGALQLEISYAGERREVLEIVPGEDRLPLRHPLAVEGRQPVRLTFGARPGRTKGVAAWWARLRRSGHGPASGVRVSAPRVLAAASETAAASVPPARDREPGLPNVIFYLIDTLRADALGVYGYDRPTSPEIDRFATEATLFRNVQAQSSWTRTAVASMITGLNPQSHRVNGRRDLMPDSLVTLPEILDEAGYTTLGFATNGNVDPRFNMDQGYDFYMRMRESKRTPEVHQLSDEVNRKSFVFLDSDGVEEGPYFLYLHTTDPHAPYTPREPFRSRFAPGVDPTVGYLDNVRGMAKGEIESPPGVERDLRDLYDGEVAFNDHYFGELIAKLKANGAYDDALIILVSDHGEEFLEHGGWEHGRTLYEEQLAVPLIIKLPGGEAAGTEVTTVVRQVDLLPTILDVLGLEIPDGLDGRSLLPSMRGSERRPEPVSYAMLALDERSAEAAVAHDHKLVESRPEPTAFPTEELYDLAADPGELRNLTGEDDFAAGYLRQMLRTLRYAQRQRARERPQEAVIDDELAEQLKALGYLN